MLRPGERVVIAEGVYRECIRTARGGTGPDTMISYEAAPGAKVVVKGAAVVKDWKPSEGWNFGLDLETHHPVKAWEMRLDPAMFPNGYNPFEVDNVLGNHTWLRYALGWPPNGRFLITSLADGSTNYPSQIGKVELLGSKSNLKCTRETQGLEIRAPDAPPCKYAYAFRIRSA